MNILPTHNLELTVYMNREEIEKLPKSPLKCNLEFYDWHTSKRTKEISVVFIYSPNTNKLIDVEQYPDQVYFGEADKIRFTIHKEVREDLLERGCSGTRFYGATGKLQIKIR